jgi:triosephosphate isomerase
VGLFTVVCAESLDRARAILGFAAISQPDLIALEPPELIGGDISVSTAQPELISAAVEVVGAGRLLVGAGVKNGMDVAIALRLGASGVLLASGVTKAADPKKVLEDLTSGS